VYTIFIARRPIFLWIIREGERQRGDEIFQHDRKSKVIQDSWTVCSAASKKTAISGENENCDKTAYTIGVPKLRRLLHFFFCSFVFFSFCVHCLEDKLCKRNTSYCAKRSV